MEANVRKKRDITELLDEYGGMIYGLCLRLTGKPDQAEDLLQETFLQAYRKWDQFRGDSSPSTWLYTIAVRKFMRMQRKRRGEPKHIPSLGELMPMGDPTVPTLPSDEETPLDATLRTEALENLEQAIVGLPSSYRIPLVMKEIVGFSVNEVASILGLKEGTVKTRLHRARLMIYEQATSVLPKKEFPPTPYTQRVCLDLLRAKQESLDQGVAFPLPGGDFCERCRTVFEGMDFSHELCRELSLDRLPAGAIDAVKRDLETMTRE